MATPVYYKEKKIVPRFRRKHFRNGVDADDAEAQALIDRDLKSEFIWTSDTTEHLQYKYDNNEVEENRQKLSIDEKVNDQLNFDIENRNENLWKYNVENEKESIQWLENDENCQISFSINNVQHVQRWSLNDLNQTMIKLNLSSQDDFKSKYDLDMNQSRQQVLFIDGEQFLDKRKFGVESNENDVNQFIKDTEDIVSIKRDANIPSIESNLSLPQTPLTVNWIKGISQYTLSMPVVDKLIREYSPLTQTLFNLDSNNLKSLKWSLDLIKENLNFSYSLSLTETQQNQYSIPDQIHIKLSIDEFNFKQLFSLNDFLFRQTLSLSSNDIQKQILTLIDSLEQTQNFGNDDSFQFNKFSLKDLQTIIFNLSPIEFQQYIYSPADAKHISIANLLVDPDEISARAFRRYRCKHVSIKSDENDQIDSNQGLTLHFKGNEQIAIGEHQIQNDLNDDENNQSYRDITTNSILLNNEIHQTYDISESDSAPINLGPCLFRKDFECEPPKTWSRLRREIGFLSFDGSLEEPIYYLNKSFKRYIHLPKKRDRCSYDVYRGYQEFIDKVKENPNNYCRPFDSTDLRHLLYWYSQKQYLFSSKKVHLLKPPTFICRRLVLRTILANLYCDSEPWKLFVVRIKGQFYLALANRATKKVEDMSKDEYSGYKFESLFTTDQPNTTRFPENIPIEQPQKQFHTVQYWQFGDFNILYSNEIDGELQINQTPGEQATRQTASMETNESLENEKSSKETKTIEEEMPNPVEEWTSETTEIKAMSIDPTGEIIEDASKKAQIDENLQLTKTDENEIVEKPKRNHSELKSGYVEMKCTNRKIFYRDENKLQTLFWWAQMWLANTNTLMIGYKSANDGIVEQIDLLSIHQLIWKFLSKYDLHLKYCISYLHSFLKLIQETVQIDDPNTIHAFAYIPQPLEIDPKTGKPVQVDLPKVVPFRYTQIKRSNKRHSNFMPEWYVQDIQRIEPIGGFLRDDQFKTVDEETKKRIGHRGRTSCVLKQENKKQIGKKTKRETKIFI